jgi:hypothetical protein
MLRLLVEIVRRQIEFAFIAVKALFGEFGCKGLSIRERG